mgnify:CR=1 FL=1
MDGLVTIPRKIYYLKQTGDFILDTGEQIGVNLRQTTVDEDFGIYTELKKYNRDSIGCIELEVGQYADDFQSCISFRVNPETLELEFAYYDENENIEYRKPLEELLKEYKNENETLKNRLETTENAILDLIIGGM